ncbi:GNAT family N-acetyltransferase [Yinghuangia soli]|uniref:GNAT family N-acetyltransferase n=1 Tax=Yinghuangia soli TaxID=2908204 RepID=A0AA41Q450_9ACTN|nr:GNAT family N-acetyltransferase [Yinghuangia soli]MCF2530361.1 GNAT family N-acetyltransferase [Yinghuangia soli]
MIRYVRVGIDGLARYRAVLLETYAEVWAADIAVDPFMRVERFDERLAGHSRMPGWGVVIGYDDDVVAGYAYGASVPAGGEARWRTVVPPVPEDVAHEPGGRTFVLFELMVRSPWRKQGIALAIHEGLLAERPESRVLLTVDPDHPKVQALYESWGYERIGVKQPVPDSPVYAVMVREPLRRSTR